MIDRVLSEPNQEKDTTPRRRLPRGSLTREVIRQAALDCLREEGSRGLTTRALAKRLGADPTAIYRHFRSTDELLADLVDALLSQLPSLEVSRPWRVEVEALALALHRVLVAHPGSVRVLAEGPHTPASNDLVERLVGLLLSHDVSPRLAATTIQAVIGLVAGWAAQAPYGSENEEQYWQGLPEAPNFVERFPALARTRSSWLAAPEKQLSGALRLLLSGVPDNSTKSA